MKNATAPEMDPSAAAQRLRDAIGASRSDDGGQAREPLVVAAVQLQGGPDHPVPCRDPLCRACACARAILLLGDHEAQSGKVPTREGALLQRGDDLRSLAEETQRVRGMLDKYAGRLSEHVQRWQAIHQALSPLGAQRSHDHDAMCTAPQAVLQAVDSVRRQLPRLAEGLLAPLRPEVRAIGHRPPDTLLVDVVRELAGAGYDKEEIVRFVAGDGLSARQRDYWLDRVDRAWRMAVKTAER